MKEIYNNCDKKLRNIHALSEKYIANISKLKFEILFPRLRLLELEFREEFALLCKLRQTAALLSKMSQNIPISPSILYKLTNYLTL